jgi:hypothetical protein
LLIVRAVLNGVVQNSKMTVFVNILFFGVLVMVLILMMEVEVVVIVTREIVLIGWEQLKQQSPYLQWEDAHRCGHSKVSGPLWQ